MEEREKGTRELKDYINPTGVTTTGYRPISSTYHLLPKELASDILTIAKTSIEDFTRVTFESDKEGNVSTLIWIPKDSRHLTDKRTQNSILGKPIERASNELKSFMEKFCGTGNGKYKLNDVILRGSDSNLRAVSVNIQHMLNIIMDMQGNVYTNITGRKNKCFLDCHWEFVKEPGRQFAAIKYLHVTKEVRRITSDLEPKTVRALRAL